MGYRPTADTSACLYDSGAPYFTTTHHRAARLVSVESNGPDCPHTAAETTARVDSVARWITTVVPDIPCADRWTTPTSQPAEASDGSE